MTSLPTPRIGQVIRYSFQFSNGDEKERPAVIIVAIQSQENNLYEVAVMPITHAPPRDPETAIEIPPRVQDHLRLSNEVRSWIVVNEINVFQWPGFDIRPVPGSNSWSYGQMPPGIMRMISRRVQELRQKPKKTLRHE